MNIILKVGGIAKLISHLPVMLGTWGSNPDVGFIQVTLMHE